MKTKRLRLIIAATLFIAVIAGTWRYTQTHATGTWTYRKHPPPPKYMRVDRIGSGTLRHNGTAWKLTVRQEEKNLIVLHAYTAQYHVRSTLPLADPVNDGHSITAINKGAFFGCGLSDVIIPDSVTSIGSGAFSCCMYMTNVIISGNVTNIGSDAFDGCSTLTSMTFNGTCPNVEEALWLYINTSSVTSYVHRAHALSWTPQLDSGSLADGTAVWCGRPIRLAEDRE